MSEPRLNVFQAYERKSEFHEDNLTRALMCVLNASPELAAAFVQKFVDAELTFVRTDRPIVQLQLQASGWDPAPFAKRYVLPISTTGADPLPENDEPDPRTERDKSLATKLGMEPEDVTEDFRNELLDDLRKSIPDAGLLWAQSGPGGLVVLIEVKTKCRQFSSQLRRHQQVFLGGERRSRISPPRQWTEVASFLDGVGRELVHGDAVGGFLIDNFLEYLEASSFGRPILPEVDMITLRECQHFARLVNDQIPAILQLAARKVSSTSGQWGLRDADVGELEEHCQNNANGHFREFKVNIRGTDWKIGIFFGLRRWVTLGHAFHVVIEGVPSQIDALVSTRPGWRRLNPARDKWCVFPIELPPQSDRWTNEAFADHLVGVLRQEYEWLRSRLSPSGGSAGDVQ